MSALTDGFNSAFGAMQSHYDRQENNKRYEQGQQRQSALDTQNNERYNDAQVRQSALDVQRNEVHNSQMASQALQQQVNQSAVDQIPIQNAQNAKQYEQGQVQYANQQAGEELKAMVASGNAGTAIYEKKYDNTNLALLRDGGGKFAKGIVDKWNKGDFAGSIPEMNKLFKTQLSKGSGEGIKSKSINNVKMVKDENGEDSLEVLLNITPSNGAPYTASLTKFRSSHPDDPISQIKMGELFDTVGGLAEFSSFMDQSGTTAATGQNANNYLAQGQKTQPMPAQAINAKYMAQAMGISEGDAWSMMNTVKDDPNALKKLKFDFMSKSVNEYDTPEEATAKRNAAAKDFDLIMGVTQQAPAPKADTPMPVDDNDPLGLRG